MTRKQKLIAYAHMFLGRAHEKRSAALVALAEADAEIARFEAELKKWEALK